MKNILWTLSFLFLLSGCSHQNAFTKFDMPKEQELSISSLQSTKILKGEDVEGILSIIYLNEVQPNIYKNKESFLICIYMKSMQTENSSQMFESKEISIKLNAKEALAVQELPKEHAFSGLLFSESPWNRYYMIVFEEEKENKLTLSLEGKGLKSNDVVYLKNQE